MNQLIQRSYRKLKRSTSPLSLFVILTIFAAIIFLIMNFLLRKTTDVVLIEVNGKSWRNSYSAYDYRTPPWLCNQLKIGQTQKSPGGKVIAQLLDVDCFEYGPNESRIYLTARINTVHDQSSNIPSFQGKEVLIGSSIDLMLGNTSLGGQIIDLNPALPFESQQFRITARWRSVEPWKRNALQVNDVVKNLSTQEIIASIEKISFEPSSLEIWVLNSSMFLNNIYPDRKDMIITTKISATKRGEDWIFAGTYPIKVGRLIKLSTENIQTDDIEIETIESIL